MDSAATRADWLGSWVRPANAAVMHRKGRSEPRPKPKPKPGPAAPRPNVRNIGAAGCWDSRCRFFKPPITQYVTHRADGKVRRAYVSREPLAVNQQLLIYRASVCLCYSVNLAFYSTEHQMRSTPNYYRVQRVQLGRNERSYSYSGWHPLFFSC